MAVRDKGPLYKLVPVILDTWSQLKLIVTAYKRLGNYLLQSAISAC